MLSILGWLFIGLFVGSMGYALMPLKKPGNADCTVLMGICGALIGGLINGSPFRAGRGEAGFFLSLALAVLGSLTVLAVHRLAGSFQPRRLTKYAGFYKMGKAIGERL